MQLQVSLPSQELWGYPVIHKLPLQHSNLASWYKFDVVVPYLENHLIGEGIEHLFALRPKSAKIL